MDVIICHRARVTRRGRGRIVLEGADLASLLLSRSVIMVEALLAFMNRYPELSMEHSNDTQSIDRGCTWGVSRRSTGRYGSLSGSRWAYLQRVIQERTYYAQTDIDRHLYLLPRDVQQRHHDQAPEHLQAASGRTGTAMGQFRQGTLRTGARESRRGDEARALIPKGAS